MAVLPKNIARISMLFLSLLITGGAFLYNIYVLSALFALCFFVYINSCRISIYSHRYLKIYWLLIGIFLLTIYHTILNDHFSSAVMIRGINFLFAYFMLICYLDDDDPTTRFIGDYIVLGKVILIHALCCTLLLITVPRAYSLMPGHETIINAWGIFFSCRPGVSNIFVSWPPRCMGMFWEPGVLQFFVNLFLYILLFQVDEKKINLLWILLCGVVVLMTQSITGIYLMVCIFIFYIIRRKKYIWLALVPFGIGISIDMFSHKILSESSEEAGSYWMRLGDTLSAWQIIKDHPLLGIGFDNDDFILLRRGVEYQGILDAEYFWDRGNTNSVLTLFYALGVPLALYMIIKLYNQKIFFKQRFLFFLIIIVSCMSEPLLLLTFPLFFMFSGMASPSVKPLQIATGDPTQEPCRHDG